MVEFVRVNQVSIEQGYTSEIYLKSLKRTILQKLTL